MYVKVSGNDAFTLMQDLKFITVPIWVITARGHGWSVSAGSVLAATLTGSTYKTRAATIPLLAFNHIHVTYKLFKAASHYLCLVRLNRFSS